MSGQKDVDYQRKPIVAVWDVTVTIRKDNADTPNPVMPINDSFEEVIETAILDEFLEEQGNGYSVNAIAKRTDK